MTEDSIRATATKGTEQQCPLCEEDNQCAIAMGASATTCWCMTTSIPDELLQQLQETDRSRCVCPNCVQSWQAMSGDSSQ